MGVRASLDGCRKCHLPPIGFDPWSVQSIASCFTNYTILANKENFAVTNGNESFIGRYYLCHLFCNIFIVLKTFSVC